jgi:hypothetical protein
MKVKVLYSTPTPGLKGSGVTTPKKAASKRKGADWLDARLRKIRRCLVAERRQTREEQLEALVRALALTLGIIERANDRRRKATRKALVERVKTQINERVPRTPSKLLLQVVKVCFPDAKISDQSQYSGFLTACLRKGWDATSMERKFFALRAKSKARVAKEIATNRDKPKHKRKDYKPAVGIKELVARERDKFVPTDWVGDKLPVLIKALKRGLN